MIYELGTWSQDLNSDFTLKDYLFGSGKLAKNADPDRYVCSGYGLGFDPPLKFSLPNLSVSKNVIIFGIDLSSSVHIDSKEKDILTLAIGPT